MAFFKIILFCLFILLVESFIQGVLISFIHYIKVADNYESSFFVEIMTSTGAFILYKSVLELWLFVGVASFRSAFRPILVRDLMIAKVSSSVLMVLILLGFVSDGMDLDILITYPIAVYLSYLLSRRLWVAAQSAINGNGEEDEKNS